MPGAISGSTTRPSVARRLAPSICAASSIATGTSRTKPASSQSTSGSANDVSASTSAAQVSRRSSARSSTNSGPTIVTCGNAVHATTESSSARLPGTGRRALLLSVVACTAFPQVTIVGPLFVLLRALDLRDTWAALVLADTSFALPLVLWLLAGFVREVPVAMEEAAQIDGAGRLATFGRVVLPLIAPGIASAGLLVFLMSWNELLFAYTFTASAASRTVPVALALFPGVYEVPWGDIAAASMLASLPPILIVAGLQRWLVRGLTAGALRD